MSTIEKIYHGCFTRQSDETRLLINFEKGKMRVWNGKSMLDGSKRYFAEIRPDKKSNKTKAHHKRPNQNKVIKF